MYRPNAKIALALSLSAAALYPTASHALGTRIADQDAFATARGDAFAATADNPSAIYYNPAGLTQLRGNNLVLSGYGITYHSDFRGKTASADSRQEVQGIPDLYYSWTAPKQKIAFGLGVYSPYGFAMDWPSTVPFRGLATKGSIEYLTVNPVIAIKPFKTLSIAAGPTFNFGKATLDNVPFAAAGASSHFSGTDNGVIGFTAGILWKPLPKHSIGLSYRSSTRMNFTGASRTTLVVPPVNDQDDPSSAGFRFPQNVVLGYSFRPTPKWNLEVDVDWTDWNSLNTVTLNTARNGAKAIPFNWQSSMFYEFGVTHYLSHGWSVSGGYIYSQNSVPNATFNPIVPDSDRHIFSIGVGKSYKSVSWNAAYQLATSFGDRTVANNPLSAEGAANGKYSFLSHAFTVDLGFHF